MQELFDFIKSSPTSLHATENVRRALVFAGFTELYEGDEWNIEEGKSYFTVRQGTSLVAFKAVAGAESFMIAASHTDSPTFKVKITEDKGGSYLTLPTERYGGMIMYSWLDRPLSVAGRVAVKTPDGISVRHVNVDSDIMTIPSLAIHYNRTVNDGYKFNPAKDTIPLLATGSDEGTLRALVAKSAGCEPSDIVNHDLFLYVREEPRTVGANGEFILSPRLDDLECVFATLKAFQRAEAKSAVPVFAVFDSEEVGSATVVGADSTFLSDVLYRIAGDKERYIKMVNSSFALSADNAHAKHPNFPELSDPQNAPVLGAGLVIKYNSSHRYATDGVGAAIFSEICERAGAKTQSFYIRADMLGGSTLGAILNTQIAVLTVDIGLPQLAMHSAVETAHVSDVGEMIKAVKAFYETKLSIRGNYVKIG